MSSRKVRAVRRRVSFSVPEETKDDVLIERTGVHAPLKVSAVEEPSLDIDSKSAPMRHDIDGEVSATSSGSSESGSDQSGSDEISSDGNDEMVQEDDLSDGLAPKAHRGTALEKVRADKGTDVSSLSAPTTCESFVDMNLDKRVSWAVAKLGWRRPTPVQAAAIPAALAGRDVLVAAPTGSGKTAAYAIPLANQLCLSQSSRAHSMSDGTFAIVLVPTRELASQVSSQLRKLLKYVQGAHVATLNSPSSISKAQSRAAIVGKRKQSGSSASVRVEEANSFVRTADVLVGTPASVVALRQDHGRSVLDKVSFVVVDEADLVLSFGHGADARSALSAIPPTAQAMLVSATLDAEGLPELRKVVLRHPMTVKVTAQSGMDPSTPDGTVPGPDVSHYFARLLSPVDRYLVTYAMLRLNVISGKVLIFTNGTNAAFRLKLFLDQFKVKSAVLNSELPANSRVHCVEQFNASIFDILIATDEMRRDDSSSRETKARKRFRSDASGASDGDVSEEDADVPDAGSEETLKKNQRKPNSAKKTAGDTEFGVARGVDFRGVAAVLNFDIPESYTSYVHRAGRTARAGASGTVLSLVVSDADQLGVVSMGKQAGIYVGPLAFQMDQIEAFRYRVEDSLRSVTNAAVRQARLAEVRREMINSDRLKDYFEDNPMDLDALKHDLSLARHVPEHLARVPGYLLPPALRDSVSVAPVRKSRVRRRSNASSALRGSKNYDPLKTFSTEKRTSGNSRQRYQCRHGVSKPGAKGGAGRTRKVGGRKNA